MIPFLHAARRMPDPAKKRNFGWQRKQMALAFNRAGFGPLCLYPTPSVWAFRMLMERTLPADIAGPAGSAPTTGR
ncbi:hypothetical protein LCGC14_2296060 [marine sediment metagenome]|uniref:Uncharacterized protein n=1 Tax=marine sediment metagenome TaxID=412755 RepID=A0A0F9DCF1_9ZZZZ